MPSSFCLAGLLRLARPATTANGSPLWSWAGRVGPGTERWWLERSVAARFFDFGDGVGGGVLAGSVADL